MLLPPRREREGVRLSERADTGKGAHVRASEGEEGDDVHRRLQRGRGRRGYPPSKGVATDMDSEGLRLSSVKGWFFSLSLFLFLSLCLSWRRRKEEEEEDTSKSRLFCCFRLPLRLLTLSMHPR